MLAVSNSIKNAYNQYTTQRKSKIKVGNNEYFIQNMSLLADAYDEGNIVGNAIAKTLEFDIETEYVKGLDEFVLYDGVWTGEQYEYINLGTFKLFEEQGADDFFSHITAYDKLILFKTEFDPNLVQFPTTIYGLLQSICSQAEVTLDTETIVNGDKMLETNLFVENETLKDILRAICQVSGTFAVISEDKLKLKLVGEDVIELEDYQISNPEYKRTTWNINQVVLGMQDIDGEYVQKSDEEDIERNGVHKIVINNNPFTYTQELRQQYINDLFDQLKGFGYFAFESDWEGLPYAELGDSIRIGSKQDYKIDLGDIELCKIGDYQDSIRKGTGKNLFDKDNVIKVDNKILNDSGVETSDNTGGYTKMYIPINPNTTYTISGLQTNGTKRIYFFDNSKGFISRTSAQYNVSSFNFTTPNNCYYIDIQYYLTNNNFNTYQIEVGSTPTEYEPYGYKGKWYLEKKIGKVVLDGSENWSKFGSVNHEYQLSLFDGLSSDGSNQYFPALSTQYKNHNVVAASLKNYEFSHFSTQPSSKKERFIRVRNNDITTLSNWKTTLQNNNLIVYVPLTTPTITEITDSTLINQLENAGVEILGETTQEGTPTPANPVPINNKTGEITVQNKRKSLVLRYQIKSPDGLNSYLQAPSIIDSVIDYIDNTDSLENKLRRTEYKVDKENSTITNLVQVTTTLDSRTTNNETTIQNNYQELITKFNDVASIDDVTQLRQSMQTTMDEQELRIENIQGILVNGVEKVVTTSGTFDEDGLTMERTGARTKSTLDETGVDVKDTQGSSNEDLFFAGYVDNDKAQSNTKLAPYEGQTVVFSKNSIVENYFTIGTHSRIEDYEDGTGVFYIGG